MCDQNKNYIRKGRNKKNERWGEEVEVVVRWWDIRYNSSTVDKKTRKGVQGFLGVHLVRTHVCVSPHDGKYKV